MPLAATWSDESGCLVERRWNLELLQGLNWRRMCLCDYVKLPALELHKPVRQVLHCRPLLFMCFFGITDELMARNVLSPHCSQKNMRAVLSNFFKQPLKMSSHVFHCCSPTACYGYIRQHESILNLCGSLFESIFSNVWPTLLTLHFPVQGCPFHWGIYELCPSKISHTAFNNKIIHLGVHSFDKIRSFDW